MDTGKVAIHGKEYKTVALRVNEFRALYPMFGIETELISANDTLVVMKATILDLDGCIISTGYAEEKRNSSNINKTSALENAETSAVGRALAFFGLAGTEIASADEVANAINNQNRQPQQERNPATSEQVRELKTKAVELEAAEDKRADWLNKQISTGMTFDRATEILEKLK